MNSRKNIYMLALTMMLLLIISPLKINAEKIDNTKEQERDGSTIVRISDSKLKLCINNELGHSGTDDVTVKDMESLTTLNCDNESGYNSNKISYLTGLEYATNLSSLSMIDNNVADIRPITKLTKLEELYMASNRVSIVSGIEGMVNLKVLDLSNNFLTNKDLEDLSKSSSIKELKIANNKSIDNFDSIYSMTNLETLDLRNNNIKDDDIILMSNLINLKELSLGINNLTDISPLSNLINLKELNLGINDLTDISPLSNLTNLEILYINDNEHLQDISPLVGLENLTYIDARSDNIIDVNPLSGMVKLKTLNLSDNYIYDVSPLEGLKKLDELYLQYNRIFDISMLPKNIKTLDVSSQNGFVTLGEISESQYKEFIRAIDFNGDILATGSENPKKYVEQRETILWDSYNFKFDGQVQFIFTIVEQANQELPVTGNPSQDLPIVNRPEPTNEVPIIKGADDIEIEVGEKFDDREGVVAEDLEDGDLTDQMKVFSKIPRTLTEGVYDIKYSVEDSDGNKTDVVRKVTVKAKGSTNIKPELYGVTDKEINIGDYFNVMDGISANDLEDGDLTSKILITYNDLDNTKVGNYVITYKVSDRDGNTVEESRNVKVIDNSQLKPDKPSEPGSRDDKNLIQTGKSILYLYNFLLIGLISFIIIRTSRI